MCHDGHGRDDDSVRSSANGNPILVFVLDGNGKRSATAPTRWDGLSRQDLVMFSATQVQAPSSPLGSAPTGTLVLIANPQKRQPGEYLPFLVTATTAASLCDRCPQWWGGGIEEAHLASVVVALPRPPSPGRTASGKHVGADERPNVPAVGRAGRTRRSLVVRDDLVRKVVLAQLHQADWIETARR